MMINKKALVIEDYRMSKNLIKLFFAELKWQDPIIVSTGEKALKCLAAEASNVDIVILDLQLPDMNGFDFYSIAKTSFPNLPPFIMITGNEDSALAQKAKELGINEFIYKNNLDEESFSSALYKALEAPE
jgi:CheY-like chemotaxis protein